VTLIEFYEFFDLLSILGYQNYAHAAETYKLAISGKPQSQRTMILKNLDIKLSVDNQFSFFCKVNSRVPAYTKVKFTYTSDRIII